MSNVLIGIIGVILFIGLALAGALFLGPRFQEATAQSKAAALIQQAHQVASAAQMYRVQEGQDVKAGSLDGQLIGTYLKSAPVNPINVYWGIDTRDVDGGQGTKAAAFATVGYPDGSTSADAICREIARQAGMTLPATGSPSFSAPPSGSQAGCYKVSTNWGPVVAGTYLVFERI